MIEGLIAALLGILFGVGGTVVYEKQRVSAGKAKAEKEIATAIKCQSSIPSRLIKQKSKPRAKSQN